MKTRSKTVKLHVETYDRLSKFLSELRAEKQAERLTFDDAVLALLEDHYRWA